MATEQVLSWARIETKIGNKYAQVFATIIEEDTKAALLRFRATGQVAMPDEHAPRLAAALRLLVSEATLAMGSRMIEEFKSGFEHLEKKVDQEDLYDRVMAAYISEYGAKKVFQITATARMALKRIIDIAYRKGQSIDEIAKIINETLPAISRWRGAIIARTETHSSSQYASMAVARESRINLNKKWNAAQDTRVRDFNEPIADFDHRSMDGVVIPLDQPYMVPRSPRIGGGFERLMFPGDPMGSAGNVINCRCVQTYERVRA
jgi:hypothetical protein